MVFITELSLGLGLVGTASRIDGAPNPTATMVRTGTALFFLIAVGALNEVRQRRPDSGCGYFGELSDTPVGLRAIARSGLLCASAIAKYLQVRGPAIRVAVLDADTDEVLGPAGTRESVVI